MGAWDTSAVLPARGQLKFARWRKVLEGICSPYCSIWCAGSPCSTAKAAAKHDECSRLVVVPSCCAPWWCVERERESGTLPTKRRGLSGRQALWGCQSLSDGAQHVSGLASWRAGRPEPEHLRSARLQHLGPVLAGRVCGERLERRGASPEFSLQTVQLGLHEWQ